MYIVHGEVASQRKTSLMDSSSGAKSVLKSDEFKDLQGGHGRAAGGAVELRKWIRQGEHLSMRLRMQNEAVPKGRINFQRWMTTWMHLEIFLF